MVDWALNGRTGLLACVAGIGLFAACGRTQLYAGAVDVDIAAGGTARGGVDGRWNGGRASFGGTSAGNGGKGGVGGGGAIGVGGKRSDTGGSVGVGGDGDAGVGGEAGDDGKRCPAGMMLGELPLVELPRTAGFWRVAVSGDFNRDGVLDFATATDGSPAVHIFLGIGDGTFVRGLEFDAGDKIFELLAVDVDGDGGLDFIVRGPLGVSVWLDRPGGFSRRPVSDAPSRLLGIQSVDVNRDGKLDLIAASPAADAVYVRLGVGDGTFLEGHEYTSGSRPDFVTAGDLNGDNVLDLVSVSRDAGTLDVLLGQPDGVFGGPVAYSLPFLAEKAALADLNGDGILDVIVGPPPGINGPIMRVWLGVGDGRLTALADTTLEWAQSWALSDIDGDRNLDLVLSRARSDVLVLAGLGDGNFAPGVAHRALIASSLLIGDANNDRRPDIIAIGADAFTLLNLGGGRFLERSELPASDIGEVKAADLDRDGKPDLVRTFRKTTGHFLNQGAGVFSTEVATPLDGDSGSLAVADFNRDGYPDRAVTLYPTGFGILWGGVGGQIVGSVDYSLTDPRFIAVGDLDADGFPDLVISRTESIVVYLGPTFTVSSEYASPANSSPITVADVSGDGLMDVAVLHAHAGTMGVFLGDGRGALSAPIESAVGSGPEVVAFADLDGDGRVEGVVSDYPNSSLHVLSNEGGGKFSIRHSYEGIFSARELAIVDMDADGILDVLSANQLGSLDLLRGVGKGALSAVERYPTGRNTVSLAVADFDGDERPDVAVGAEELDILFNRCR